MGTLIKATGEVSTVVPRSGSSFALDELQAFVGGYIEIVRRPGAEMGLVVNEDGKREGLPVNRKATALGHSSAGGLQPDDVIVGDALWATLQELGGI